MLTAAFSMPLNAFDSLFSNWNGKKSRNNEAENLATQLPTWTKMFKISKLVQVLMYMSMSSGPCIALSRINVKSKLGQRSKLLIEQFPNRKMLIDLRHHKLYDALYCLRSPILQFF